ncbi:putative holin-like toxin [Cohnella lupini]|uniref:putative holin-like toxin n=1 Tax=Cohnella lupini TaxID=1294267 RepID=UPI00319DDA2A
MLKNSAIKIVLFSLPLLTKCHIIDLQLVSGDSAFKKKEEAVMDIFQSLTIMFAFGVFILTLLTYIDKRK